MALTGPAAKDIKHGRTPNADWTDVVDTPYLGPSPDLPKLSGRRRWHEQVVAWWNEVRQMPHCVLWAATDWRFGVETAVMKQQLWTDLEAGEMKTTLATEIRRREDQMGTTGEARRKLRVRYVGADEAAGQAAGAVFGRGETAGGGTVTELTSRRARLSA